VTSQRTSVSVVRGIGARWSKCSNATRPLDGYLEFQRRPQPMLKWFEANMAA